METTSIILILLFIFLALAGLFLVAAFIALILGRKQIQKFLYKFLKPSPEDIQKDIARLHLKYPGMEVDDLVAAYIKDQAKLMALVGLLTEVWGLFIPFLGFAVDISFFTTIRQMKMAHVITALYPNERLDPEELEIKYMSIVGGGNLMIRIILKFLGSPFPGFGGIINAILNWVFTKIIGKAAIAMAHETRFRDAARNEIKDKLMDAKKNTIDRVTGSRQADVDEPELLRPVRTEDIPPAAAAREFDDEDSQG